MKINPLTFKMSYANLRGRVHSSNTSGIYAPDSFGGFLLSEQIRECREYNRLLPNNLGHLVLSCELPKPQRNLRDFITRNTRMTNSISIYNFEQNQIRTQVINGEPYFCLVDACVALGLSNSRKTKTQLSEGGVIKSYTPTKSGIQEVTFINEPNLYRLIFRSNKPQAQAFADWVYSEVLPAIRRQGYYGTPDKEVMKSLGGIVKSCCASAFRTEFEKAMTDIVYTDKFKQLIQSSFSELFSSPKDKGLQNWCSSTIAQIIEAQAALMAEEKFNEYAKDAQKALDKYSTKSATQLFIEQEVKKLYGRN